MSTTPSPGNKTHPYISASSRLTTQTLHTAASEAANSGHNTALSAACFASGPGSGLQGPTWTTPPQKISAIWTRRRGSNH
ncbi:uncharacterized protein VTP21DRAFT_11012 [Calcarisporiella thermophila]|uniref:uncharacterized protein n=1 Tax=Calcarisporiella thermophila TaxID=911321 RepID=UPI0037438B34